MTEKDYTSKGAKADLKSKASNQPKAAKLKKDAAKAEKEDIWSEEAVSSKKAAAEKKETKKEKAIFVPKASHEKTESGMELNEVLIFPLISEKAVGAIEAQNKITFIVNQKASKIDIRTAIEKLYAVKVESVQTLRDNQGRKKAIVKLGKAFKAQELATKLGVV
ncbi:MAG: 50S ribosomal protein L23 [Candidatus Diapherotrites archaeon]|nr:50S ribosomal protein L23 [Candidatus Diapherotrites archaeon]